MSDCLPVLWLPKTLYQAHFHSVPHGPQTSECAYPNAQQQTFPTIASLTKYTYSAHYLQDDEFDFELPVQQREYMHRYTSNHECGKGSVVQLGCYQHRHEREGLWCSSRVRLLSTRTRMNTMAPVHIRLSLNYCHVLNNHVANRTVAVEASY